METRDLLWNQTKPYWREWTAGVGLRVVFRLLPLQVPIVAGWMIQKLQQGGGALHEPGVCLVGLAALTGLTAYGSDVMRRRVDGELSDGLRRRVWEAWQQAAPSYRVRHGLDRLQTQTLPYAGALGDLTANLAMEGIAMACRMAYPVVMLLWLDPWLALLPLSLLPVQTVLGRLARIHGRQFVQQERHARQRNKRAWRETVESAETWQALGAQAAGWERIEHAGRSLAEHGGRRSRYERMLSGGVWAVAALGLALSWWGGAARCAAGHMSLGQLVTFTGFAAFLGLPLRRFGVLGSQASQALDRLREVGLFLREAAAARREVMAPGRGLRAGELQLVDVRHELGTQAVFHRLNAVFPAGELILVRGRGGSGKSMLLRLLAGLEAAVAGRILLDGEEIVGLNPDVLLVEGEAPVFEGTLRENLALGWPGAREEELRLALEQARWGALPQGLDTVLGDGGYRLAAADRQRLGIARALVRRPRVLLLDEATTGLEEAAEQELLEHLGRLKPCMTVILVASRLRSLAAIDRVMEVGDGQLTQWQPVALKGSER